MMSGNTPQHRLPPLIRLRVACLRAVAAAYLGFENLLTVMWPLVLWCAVFASLWLIQMPQWFGRGVEIAAAVIFFIGAGWFAARAIKAFRLPRHADITRRIEQDNHMSHRPLSGLEDRLANPVGTETRRLWGIWQAGLHPALLSLGWPRLRAVMTGRDPYAFRVLVFCLLLVAATIAGGTWESRLRHGLVPFSPLRTVAGPTDNVVIWITPPAYTRQPQITLKGFGKKDSTVTIPEDSIIKARVSGWPGTPDFILGDTPIPMEQLGEGNFGIEIPAKDVTRIGIRQMFIPRSRWATTYIPDTPPTIAMTGEPEILPRAEMVLPLRVRDDYGVETMQIDIALDKPVDAAMLGAPYTETLNVMSPPDADMDFKPEFDLAWHPWAGQPVKVTLTATDHKGQKATASDIKLTLPERGFSHPTARKLVEMRKRLIWTPEAAAPNVAHEIEAIMRYPDRYHNDRRVFLGLRVAASRIVHDGSRAAIVSVVPLLWDIALRIEDGNFTLARRDLQDAQKALQDALQNPDATPEEIAARMEELRMAMAQYMNEVYRELQKRMAEGGDKMPLMTPDAMMQSMSPADIAAFLDQMQAEAIAGDRDAAREMLAQMERMMRMIDPARMETAMPQDMQDMMEAMEKIQKIIERQKALLEETQAIHGDAARQQTYGDPLPPDSGLMEQWGITDLPPPPQENYNDGNGSAPRADIDTSAGQTEQDSIRTALGEVMVTFGEKLGDIPLSMARADESMRQSSAALGLNDPATAIPHQEDAIRHLSEGQQDMGRQLAERMKQMMMFSMGMGGRFDPLGRPMDDGEGGSTPWSASRVKIPDKAERRKVQDILDDLRKKSGELQRPAYERDYFHRLMRQF